MAWLSPAVAVTELGAAAVDDGVTPPDGLDVGPVPTRFVAVTVKVYAVPLVRPATVAEVAAVVAVAPPGDAVTLELVTVAPPFEAGAVHDTVAEPSPGLAATAVVAFVTEPATVVGATLPGDAVTV